MGNAVSPPQAAHALRWLIRSAAKGCHGVKRQKLDRVPKDGCASANGTMRPLKPFEPVATYPSAMPKLPTPVAQNRPCEGSMRLWREVLKKKAYGIDSEELATIANSKCPLREHNWKKDKNRFALDDVHDKGTECCQTKETVVQLKKRLGGQNPQFYEWLMGFEANYTHVPAV